MDYISYWRELNDGFINFLVEKGYNHSSTQSYRKTINLLIRFANANGYDTYTQEIGEKFLESEVRLMYLKQDSYQRQRLTIRRFNEYLDGEKYLYRCQQMNYECPEAFKEVLGQYVKSLEIENLKQCTIEAHRVFAIKLFIDFANNGTESWGTVDAKALTSAFDRAVSKSHFVKHIRKLFDFLVKKGIIKHNYAEVIPKMSSCKSIPSVYNHDEIKAILESVDRSNKVGKRNYAVLLLAARLGMRACDISFLCFENIDFDKAIIEFTQQKTGVINQLPLLPEIGEALQDYINNARGDSIEPYIFLSVRKSIKSQMSSGAIRNVAVKYFHQSGIEINNRSYGVHAFRRSLASDLVAENVPYEAVRTILGHEDHDAITHYVKFDTESLRSCALDVPMASGKFAEYLASGKEVS